jgi:threonine dehydrogenase-like Zn-dependent dehydrogenase
VKALVFGTATQPWTPPPDATPLAQNLASTPCALIDVPDARPLRPDWYVVRPLLTGICGSDSKQILLDFEGDADSAMSGLCSFPQVMGHEVVGEVVEAGPDAAGFELGERVVLNPWLSCAPRGMPVLCPACEQGDYSLCWSFTAGDITPGIHTGVSSDATGGYAELMPAHSTMLFRVPDTIDDEHAIFADPFAVSLHSVTRHPPPPEGKALVWGAGALGSCALAILRALYPSVEVAVVARFDAQAALAEKLGAAKVFRLAPKAEMVERLADWSGGVLKPTMEGLDAIPMCHPGTIDVAYDTIAKPETFEVEVRVLKARGTLVKSGVHAPGGGSGARCTSRRSAGSGPTPSEWRRSRASASTASSTTSTWRQPGASTSRGCSPTRSGSPSGRTRSRPWRTRNAAAPSRSPSIPRGNP